jgi:hypothetical protein
MGISLNEIYSYLIQLKLQKIETILIYSHSGSLIKKKQTL